MNSSSCMCRNYACKSFLRILIVYVFPLLTQSGYFKFSSCKFNFLVLNFLLIYHLLIIIRILYFLKLIKNMLDKLNYLSWFWLLTGGLPSHPYCFDLFCSLWTWARTFLVLGITLIVPALSFRILPDLRKWTLLNNQKLF